MNKTYPQNIKDQKPDTELVAQYGEKTSHVLKASVFEDLFSTLINLRELAKELKLYLTDEQIKDLKITRVITEGPTNDVAFQIGDLAIVLIEAQSTDPINIPVRMLAYVGTIGIAYLGEKDENGHTKRNVYGTQRIVLPPYKLYAVYPFNDEKKEDGKDKSGNYDLPLYDDPTASDVNLTVHVIKKVEGDGLLAQYIQFCLAVRKVWEKHGGLHEAAFKELMDYCMENNILVEYLKGRWDEVERILSYEYAERLKAEAKLMEGMAKGKEIGLAKGKEIGLAKGKEIGLAEGRAMGEEKAMTRIALNLLNSNMSPEDVAKNTGLPLSEVKKLRKPLN